MQNNRTLTSNGTTLPHTSWSRKGHTPHNNGHIFTVKQQAKAYKVMMQMSWSLREKMQREAITLQQTSTHTITTTKVSKESKQNK